MSINTYIPEERRGLQIHVEAMFEDIILNGMTLENYRERLGIWCKSEGLSNYEYEALVDDLADLIENVQMGLGSPDGLAIGIAMAFVLEDAAKCYISQEKIEQICEKWNVLHPNREFHPHHPIQ